MNSETMSKAILDMTKTLGNIEGTVLSMKDKIDSHDVLLREHTNLLNTIDHRTIGIDSWKNGVIKNVIDHKEQTIKLLRDEAHAKGEIFERRINELEKLRDEKVAEKKEIVLETKKRLRDYAWDAVKTVSYISIGYLFTKIK